MKFGSYPLNECQGAILAHSLRLGGLRLKKGIKLNSEILGDIASHGIEYLTVAIGEEADLFEDEAALQIAQTFKTQGVEFVEVGTGRVNLRARHNGVFVVNAGVVDDLNGLDPSVTMATLEPFEPVERGRMVATIKIIPYFVSGNVVESAKKLLKEKEVMSVRAYRAFKVATISTKLPSLKQSTIDKTERILINRLSASGSTIASHNIVDHQPEAIKSALLDLDKEVDLTVVFGASAISDIGDVIPQGLIKAGGKVDRLGMPVDPGNLLMMGELAGKPVIGAPGCARSSARNGFDFVLERLLCGLPYRPAEIAGLGVGGLLKEIATRPSPRENRTAPRQTGSKRISAVILAAGRSSRMGQQNKLLMPLHGRPILDHVIEAARKADAVDEIIVVCGHQADEIKNLVGKRAKIVLNPDYREGLSTSLRVGVETVSGKTSHIAVMLGDMPVISSSQIDEMAQQLSLDNVDDDRSIIVATHHGKRGNPVIWPAHYFDQIRKIEGDIGARHLLEENQSWLIEVEIGKASSIDVDTRETFTALNARQR